MNLSVFDIKRQGIYKKFPNFEFYVKHLDNSDAQIFLDLLDRYIQDGNFQCEFEFGTFDYNIMYAFNGLGSYLQRFKQESFSDFYTKNIFNENLFYKAIQYRYWQIRFELHQSLKLINLFQKDELEQLHTSLFLKTNISELGVYLQFGMLNECKYLTNKYLDFINSSIKIFVDGGDTYHRRTQYFILRLLNQYWFKREVNFPKCAFDEPLFNQLIENWDTKDLLLLQHLLLCLCDRHTHQTKYDTATKFYDISDFTFAYLPVEVHSIMRLRAEKGLENPVLDHIIINTPLGKLFSKQVPYMDDFLLGILKRARQEFPDFADDLFAEGAPYEVAVKQISIKNSWKFWKNNEHF